MWQLKPIAAGIGVKEKMIGDTQLETSISSNWLGLSDENLEQMTPDVIQKMLTAKGTRKEPIHDVYRLLYNKGIYGRHIEPVTLEYCIDELKKGTFRWYGLNHKYMTKDGRLITMPSPIEKIVSGGLRTLLSWYYEPMFSRWNHGFRPNKGPATAVKAIRAWKGVEWIRHYDIVSCFPSIKWDMLDRRGDLGLVKDYRLRFMLKELALTGLPVGSPISPLLCNVYLNDVDHNHGYDFYLRYADNIIVGGKKEGRSNRIQEILERYGLETRVAGSTFLSTCMGVYNGQVVITRPDEYAVSMIPYYEGMGI